MRERGDNHLEGIHFPGHSRSFCVEGGKLVESSSFWGGKSLMKGVGVTENKLAMGTSLQKRKG